MTPTTSWTRPAGRAEHDRLALHSPLGALPLRDSTILTLRFFGNRTQNEIAAELGISQMHVSRLLNSAHPAAEGARDRLTAASGRLSCSYF